MNHRRRSRLGRSAAVVGLREGEKMTAPPSASLRNRPRSARHLAGTGGARPGGRRARLRRPHTSSTTSTACATSWTRPTRLHDAGRDRHRHRAGPARRDGLRQHLPQPRLPPQAGGHGRPHLRRPGRFRRRRRLAGARARGLRLGVPLRRASASTASPRRWRSGTCCSARSAPPTTAATTRSSTRPSSRNRSSARGCPC